MKLTPCLQRKNYTWLMNQMWKYGRSRVKPTYLNLPIYLKNKGTHITAASEILDIDKPVFPKWEPPVKDDPRVKPSWKPQDHVDYHEQPIYQFTPNNQLEEGDVQACILTKSQSFNSLPPSITNLLGAFSIKEQDMLMKRIILRSHKFEPTKVKLPKRKNPNLPIWNFKAEYGIPDSKIAKLLLEGVLGLCSSLTGQYPDLAISRTIASNVLHSSFFSYNNNTDISIKGNMDAILYSSKQLPSFASDDLIDHSLSHRLPSIYPLSPTIDLTHQHIWNFDNNLGFKEPFSFPHPHTIFLTHEDSWSSSQRNARALMFCFGNAVAVAKNLYGSDVIDLPAPVSTQCVMTNGVSFTFTCFQLNSLNYKSPIKNMVWFDSDNQLFNKVIPKRSMLRHTKYQDYDPEVIKKVLAFYANGADLTKGDFFSDNSD